MADNNNSTPNEQLPGNQPDETPDDLNRFRLPPVIVPGDGSRITDSAEQLFKAIAPSHHLFYMDGEIVELQVDQSTGKHHIQPLNAVAATSRFEKYVTFVRCIGQSLAKKRVVINESLAKQYLSSEAARLYLPCLKGILHCPLLIEKEGKLCPTTTGFNPETGLYVIKGAQPHTIPLNEAVENIKLFLQDFDFVSDGDKSRAIASFITPALKLGGLLKGPVPMDVAEADQSQAGKGYRQKLVGAVYNQKLAEITMRKGGVGSLDESFSDVLIRGEVFIQFDNIRGKLTSQLLESFMTSGGNSSVRIPYRGSVHVDVSKYILFLSSNGFEATPDLVNRASIIRIRKRVGHTYWQHDGMDMLSFMFKNQPEFLGSVLAVVREWFKRGKPKTNETRHDFREWCQSLDWIVRHLFKEAPLLDGHQAATQRASNVSLTFLRTVSLKLSELNRLNCPYSASELTDLCITHQIPIPGLTGELTNEAGRKQIGKIFGNAFSEHEVLPLEGFQVTRANVSQRTQVGNAQTVNRYTFTRATPPPPSDDLNQTGRQEKS